VTTPAIPADSPLTSPAAVLAACVDAVRDAVAVNAAQQEAAGRWMSASEPEVPAVSPVGGVDARL
jgi:hypothetical protein